MMKRNSVPTNPVNRPGAGLFAAALLLAGLGGGAAATQLSQGIYRIPYADGTKVHINHAVDDHKPSPGRLDMTGRGGGPYRIVAAADGHIRFIVDSNSKQQGLLSNKDKCHNNYVWIEHANGEWTKYSHMQQGTTTGKAGLKVGDFVTAGTYLGDEGKVGCATSAHLHFEVGVPHPNDPIVLVGGYLKDNDHSNRNRDPVICGIEGRTFQDGENYVAVAGPGEVSPGMDEIIRHGMPKHNYQCLLERGIAAGYQPTWIDFFNVGKDIHVNVVLRPITAGWQSRSGMDGDGLEQQNQRLKAEGYRLSHLESYLDGGVRYAALWEKRSGPAQTYYYGFSADEHSQKVGELKNRGYRPRTVSVVAHSGLKYAALWEQVAGGWELRSSLTPDEYREKARENHERGWEVVFLNSYVDKKQPYLSAIWRPGIDGEVRRRTALGKKDFDFEWQSARKADLLTTAVTAYEVKDHAEYSGVFRE